MNIVDERLLEYTNEALSVLKYKWPKCVGAVNEKV